MFSITLRLGRLFENGLKAQDQNLGPGLQSVLQRLINLKDQLFPIKPCAVLFCLVKFFLDEI